MKYNNCELNALNYEKALIYDYRSLSQVYSSLLISKHIILFSFYPIKDYNIRIIKINLFILSFDIHFAINTTFFNDTAIHQIYEDRGKYNISFFMPKIFLAFLFSYYCICIIRYLSLSERIFLEIKNEENKVKLTELVQKSKRNLIIRYIIFYILSLIFLIVFWYYLSSFCALYRNTQSFLIKNTFISFGISLIFPLIYNLFPSAIRIHSFKERNECLYKFSSILQLF